MRPFRVFNAPRLLPQHLNLRPAVQQVIEHCGIRARVAEQRVSLPIPRIKGVIAGAAVHQIPADPAIERVVTGVTLQRVVPTLAQHPVITIAANEQVTRHLRQLPRSNRPRPPSVDCYT